MTAEPEGALGPYLRAIREHWIVVVLIVVAAFAGAVAWLAVRSPQYEAGAEILVTPLAQDDEIYIGLTLLRDSGEPTRTIQTAATLIDSDEAAETAAREVGSGLTPSDVSEIVKVQPKGESNVLDVIATADSPRLAAEIANAFATGALDFRRRQLADQVARTLDDLRGRRDALVGDAAATEAASDLQRRIGALEELEQGNDPTLRVTEAASPSDDPVGAPSWLVLALALIGGTVLGTGIALAMRLADRDIRDEDEVLDVYPLPVLSRVPVLPRRVLRRSGMAPQIREAFRTLVAQLEVRAPGDRVILLTSASRNDGKTSSAINLAMSLVAGGHRVILIDFDLRKPDIAARLRIRQREGLASLLGGDVLLEDLLVPAPDLPLLRVATAASTAGDMALLEALVRRLPAILDEASQLADYVVIDTAPIGEVSDAVKVVDHVDQVLLVVRPSNTNRVNLAQSRDLLESTGRSPLGLVVLGQRRGGSSRYYAYGTERTRGERVGT